MRPSVLISGSGSGLGKATALHFANHGYRVFAGVRRESDGQLLRQANPSIEPVLLDVADPAQRRAAARYIDEACGSAGLAMLINNAGFASYTPIEHADDADVDGLFDVVAFAPYRLTNALLPALKRHAARSGDNAKVLNIISWAALDVTPFVGFYSAAKAAALRLTQTQSLELERFGIDVVAVVPGLTRTPFIEQAGAQIEAVIERLSAQGRADYGSSLRHLARLSVGAPRNPLAADPAVVAARIHAIAAKRRPKNLYHLGIDTRLVQLLGLLPSCVVRRIKHSLYGTFGRIGGVGPIQSLPQPG